MSHAQSPLLPPSNTKELKVLIAGRTLPLSKGAQRILEKGFRRPDIIAFGTASSIATQCEVGPTTVGRLTKSLGFGSLREFRQLFRDQLVSAKNTCGPAS